MRKQIHISLLGEIFIIEPDEKNWVTGIGKFRLGDKVRKKPRERGANFCGVICGAHENLAGIGYAVRCEAKGVEGTVQVYSEDMLELDGEE